MSSIRSVLHVEGEMPNVSAARQSSLFHYRTWCRHHTYIRVVFQLIFTHRPYFAQRSVSYIRVFFHTDIQSYDPYFAQQVVLCLCEARFDSCVCVCSSH